jgi:hypothetical protein
LCRKHTAAPSVTAARDGALCSTGKVVATAPEGSASSSPNAVPVEADAPFRSCDGPPGSART